MPKKGGVPQNLKSYKPGQSGNPAGKPKGTKNLSTILKEMLEASTKIKREDKEERVTFKESIAFSLLEKAKGGDVAAIREVFDRLEGKPDQKINQITEMTINVKRK